MKIQKTFERKTKKNHFRRYFADDGSVLWYVFLNKRMFTALIKRTYSDLKEEVFTEEALPVSELPQIIFDFIAKDLNGAK